MWIHFLSVSEFLLTDVKPDTALPKTNIGLQVLSVYCFIESVIEIVSIFIN